MEVLEVIHTHTHSHTCHGAGTRGALPLTLRAGRHNNKLILKSKKSGNETKCTEESLKQD